MATLTVALPETKPDTRPSALPAGRADRYAQMVVLSLLLAAPAIMCLHSAVANDPDIWWHMRTGEWVVQHHAIPRVDIFSGPYAGKPWQAYSWLFELLTFGLFHRFGLVGIVGYSVGMLLAITCALSHLVRRLQADFTVVALLVFSSCFAMGHLYTPRPWLFTILFFAIELDILMQARRTGRMRELLWLPVIFALWSNIHIQFIDGLVVLGLAMIEPIAATRGIGQKARLGFAPAAAAFAASGLATLANPYSWHIYRVAYDLASQAGVLDKITELRAIAFRGIVDWVVLALAICATVVLARQRQFRFFETALLAFGIYVGFRSQRDVWVIAIGAVAILASVISPRANLKDIQLPRFTQTFAAVAAALLVLAGFRVMHVNNALLETQIEKTYPVKAVAAIQAGHYSGPLYNNFDWGGYLIWALRMPVAMDGRAAFYGDQAIDRSVATWGAEPDWKSDPLLTKAGLVIAPPKAALSQLLRADSSYRLVYEDKIAVVFVAQR